MVGKASRLVLRKSSVFTISDYGKSVYGEKISKEGQRYLRQWNPKRSKLAALLTKETRFIPFTEDSKVLYLGAASGTTVSHVADLVPGGRVYGVELSYVPFLKLLELSEARSNIIPILEDARALEKYQFLVDSPDIIYQDISQRDQVSIFNQAIKFWPTIRYGFLVLKIRSISFSRRDNEILRESVQGIKGMKVKYTVDLKPFHMNTFMLCLSRSQT